ncbi:MAG: hypothetical protein AAB110_02085, partial [Candidatus Desantisbacteria bacterium]
MSKEHALTVFDDFKIRRIYDEKSETWYFSVVDIVAALIQQPNYQTARKYWKVLKGRLAKEGSELVTNCYQLKMTADDGKQRFTDTANAETLLRLVQSVPSPMAEPIKSLHLDSERTWRGGEQQVLYLLLGLREKGHEVATFIKEEALAG